MIAPKVFTVAQVNRYINGIFENDFLLQSLWVKGEISNYKKHSVGHLYFTLKDSSGALKCIMFRADAEIMPFELDNGMAVTLYGYVAVYEKTGQYQLYVQMVEPTGIGSLAIAFEQLKCKLEEEGLFDLDFKREICKNPKTVAVITSPKGAAVRDIINVAKRRNSGVEIVVVPALVQGENAAKDIVNAIKAVNAWGKADTIILGRGGGSVEDLWCFNEESVARAIFASEIPVISAVGHETDFTISDFVADLRTPTPSAAAELAINDLEVDKESINAFRLRLSFSMNKIIEIRKKHIESLSKSSILRKPYENMVNSIIELDRIKKDMDKNMELALSNQKLRLTRSMEALALLSPMNILKRGYSVTFDDKGNALTDIKNVNIGDNIEIAMHKGKISAVVKGVERNGGKKETDVL